MRRCANCLKFIFGGKKHGDLRFCNDACYQEGYLLPLAEQAAPELVASRLREIREQACPVCGGEGPLDIHTSYTVWSVIVFTYYRSHPRLSCAKCGRKSIRRGIATSALLGWWGMPFGLFITPLQLVQGAQSLATTRPGVPPTKELQTLVKLEVAEMVRETVRG